MAVPETYQRLPKLRPAANDDAPFLPTCTLADPFGIDHDCISETGHQPVVSCGAIVCFHCARIFWQ